jgi:hypothetical protein
MLPLKVIINGLEPQEPLNIRHLAILKPKDAWHRGIEVNLVDHLTWFRKLETLTMVRTGLQHRLPEENEGVNSGRLGAESA